MYDIENGGYLICDECEQVGDLYAIEKDNYEGDYCLECAMNIARDYLEKGVNLRIAPVEYQEQTDFFTGERTARREVKI